MGGERCTSGSLPKAYFDVRDDESSGSVNNLVLLLYEGCPENYSPYFFLTTNKARNLRFQVIQISSSRRLCTKL